MYKMNYKKVHLRKYRHHAHITYSVYRYVHRRSVSLQSDTANYWSGVHNTLFLHFISFIPIYIYIFVIFTGLCERWSFWQHFRLFEKKCQKRKEKLFPVLASCHVNVSFFALVNCNNPGPHPQFCSSLFSLLYSEEAKPDQSCTLKMTVTNHYFWSLWSLARSLPRSPPTLLSTHAWALSLSQEQIPAM